MNVLDSFWCVQDFIVLYNCDIYIMTKMAALVNAEDLVDSDGNIDVGVCNC
jgi:hypothetical protein